MKLLKLALFFALLTSQQLSWSSLAPAFKEIPVLDMLFKNIDAAVSGSKKYGDAILARKGIQIVGLDELARARHLREHAEELTSRLGPVVESYLSRAQVDLKSANDADFQRLAGVFEGIVRSDQHAYQGNQKGYITGRTKQLLNGDSLKAFFSGEASAEQTQNMAEALSLVAYLELKAANPTAFKKLKAEGKMFSAAERYSALPEVLESFHEAVLPVQARGTGVAKHLADHSPVENNTAAKQSFLSLLRKPAFKKVFGATSAERKNTVANFNAMLDRLAKDGQPLSATDLATLRTTLEYVNQAPESVQKYFAMRMNLKSSAADKAGVGQAMDTKDELVTTLNHILSLKGKDANSEDLKAIGDLAELYEKHGITSEAELHALIKKLPPEEAKKVEADLCACTGSCKALAS